MDVGQRIKYLREAAGISQEALAERANLARKTIMALEKNVNSPTVKVLARILDALEVDFIRFFQSGAPKGLKHPKDEEFHRMLQDILELGGKHRIGMLLDIEAIHAYAKKEESDGAGTARTALRIQPKRSVTASAE